MPVLHLDKIERRLVLLEKDEIGIVFKELQNLATLALEELLILGQLGMRVFVSGPEQLLRMNTAK